MIYNNLLCDFRGLCYFPSQSHKLKKLLKYIAFFKYLLKKKVKE
jgi:hypothetical protein